MRAQEWIAAWKASRGGPAPAAAAKKAAPKAEEGEGGPRGEPVVMDPVADTLNMLKGMFGRQ